MGIQSGVNLFGIETTMFAGLTPPTTPGQEEAMEGMVKQFENRSPTDRTVMRTGAGHKPLTCVLVRNVSTAVLLPGQVCSWKSGYRGLRVDGATVTDLAEPAGLVPDYLPTSGVPVNDLFWLVVKGRMLANTDVVGDIGTNFSAGSLLVAQTAAASTGTTAGRVQLHTITANTDHAGADILNTVINRVGRAITANLTTQTARQVLIDVDIFGY